MQETDNFVSVLPPFISANLTIFKQFTTYILCISCVLRTGTEDCCTAFYHQIKNSFSYHEPSPERPLYNHQLCSTLRDWYVFFCSFFHTDVFAVMLWETNHGLILVPGYRQEGAASCAAQNQYFESLPFESWEQLGHNKDKSPCLHVAGICLQLPDHHLCSALDQPTEHLIQEALLS